MKYFVDKNSKEAAYMQLYHQLRRDIISGALPLGSRLPSKRTLAGALELSLVTVEHAYSLLLDEGYAEARERSGYFAAFGGAPRQEAPLPKLHEHDSMSDVPEDFPFSSLARVMRRVLSDYDRRILIKSPGSGCVELRSAIAAYLERSRGLAVDPEQIIIGSGAEYLYSMIVQLLGRDTVFAHEEPCYSRILQVYEANGVRCEGLPIGEDGIISSALQASGAGALHVTPFNSYPSRITASATKRHEYAAWAAERGSIIVEDDYDSEFSSLTRYIETIYSLAPERVIYLNTFSRTIMPSMRMAYMVLPLPILEKYRQKLGFYSCTVPVYEQYVLAEYINSGELERHINRRRRQMKK